MKRRTTVEYVKLCVIKHKNFYSYDKTVYVNKRTKVIVTCPVHGDWAVDPHNHLRGSICNRCSMLTQSSTTPISKDEFVLKSTRKHGNLFTCDKVIYITSKHKVCITCNRCGYEFWQQPCNHIHGQGCPLCKESKGEKNIRGFLCLMNIKFEREKKFSGCYHIAPLRFDFYLPDYNICIEYDGEQHFKSVPWFGGVVGFERMKIRDKIKDDFCREMNITLIRIRYSVSETECIEIIKEFL